MLMKCPGLRIIQIWDFGLAVILPRLSDVLAEERRRELRARGTPTYRPPEQFTERGDDQDRATGGVAGAYGKPNIFIVHHSFSANCLRVAEYLSISHWCNAKFKNRESFKHLVYGNSHVAARHAELGKVHCCRKAISPSLPRLHILQKTKRQHLRPRNGNHALLKYTKTAYLWVHVRNSSAPAPARRFKDKSHCWYR